MKIEIDKLSSDGCTDKQTKIVTSWALDGAKNNFLFQADGDAGRAVLHG